MKLLLCSEGFATPNTVQKCVELVGKPQDQIKVGIINEAFAVEDGDKRWVLNNLNYVFQNFRAEVDIVDLLALSIEQIEERLSDKDVIFVVGGHTDYLMSVFHKSGFDNLLSKLLETKVYVGSSAGSQVVSKRISEEAYKNMYGEEGTYGTTQYLELVDLSIMPHLDSPNYPNRRETFLEAVKNYDGKVYGLNDDSAVVIDGDKIYTIGSEPLIVDGGQISNE